MKSIKKFCILLCLILSFTAVFSMVACNNSGAPQEPQDPGVQPESRYELTEIDLLANGTSDYKIVIPTQIRGYEETAAVQIQTYFEEATSFRLPIVRETEVVVSDTSRLIILGETQLAEDAGISVDKATLGPQAFKIKQIDGNVYIIGGDTNGTLNGAFEFLRQQFSFERYAINEYYIANGVKDKKLIAFDYSDKPDIAYNQGIHDYYRAGNETKAYSMGFSTQDEVYINNTMTNWHNSFILISPKIYNDPKKPETYHPKWFLSNKKQLHYTAHGDEAELQLMLELILENYKQGITEYFSQGKYYEYLSLSMEDTNGFWANSDECYLQEGAVGYWEYDETHVDSVLSLKEKYGNTYPAAMMIIFVNKLQSMLDEWLEATYPGRKVSIIFTAYNDTEPAPVEIIDGEYVPMDEEVVLHENAGVYVAMIHNQFHEDFVGSSGQISLEKWSYLSKRTFTQFYDFYHSNTMLYMDNIYALSSHYMGMKKYNVIYNFYESPITRQTYHPMGRLKVYLHGKLGWHADADVNVLIENFMNNYFKDAAPYMMKYLDSLVSYFAYLKSEFSIPGLNGGGVPVGINYWNSTILQEWMGYFEAAYSSIEYLQGTNNKLWQELYDRICYETLMTRYLLLYNFPVEAFSASEFIEEVAQFKADADRLDVVSASLIGALKDFKFSR